MCFDNNLAAILYASEVTSRTGGVAMGFSTKVQTIKRKNSEQWYINFPSALAQACEFGYGENVEWILEDRFTLTLKRAEAERAAAVAVQQKKKRP